MRQADFRDFSAMLDAVCGLLSRGNYTPNAQNTALFFRALARHDIAVIRAAFDAHVCDPVRGKFVPVPADILAQIETIVADDGRPGAEEAWATVFAARDEALTTVWTAEMAEAAGVSRSLLLAGDEVAARMAFKEAYTRLVSTARAQRIPAAWSATLGHDIAGRDAALLPHIKAGRISNAFLAGPSIGLDAAMRLRAPEGMSESNRAARAKAREKLAELRAEMTSRKAGSTAAEVERQRTEALKTEAASRVRNYTDTSTTFKATGA